MHYRINVYNALSKNYDLIIAHSGNGQDFENRHITEATVKLSSFFGIKWQSGLLALVKQHKPNAVWIAADVNYLSSLWLIINCRFRQIPVVLHGQGLVKKSKCAWIRRLMLKTWINLANYYVGYASPCTESLKQSGVSARKLTTINNRLEVPKIHRNHSINSAQTKGVLFIGRLRQSCNIEKLISALVNINKSQDAPTHLHVIGDGSERRGVADATSLYQWIHWHGEITSTDKISQICKSCEIGVYPGRAGLSVLSYMQFGLAVIVASDISWHMGPEPSYVVDGVNGWTFDQDDPNALENVLCKALASPSLNIVRKRSQATFNELHKESYADEMARIIGQVIENSNKLRA